MLQLARSREPGRSFGLPRQLNPGGVFFCQNSARHQWLRAWDFHRLRSLLPRANAMRSSPYELSRARRDMAILCKLHIAVCRPPLPVPLSTPKLHQAGREGIWKQMLSRNESSEFGGSEMCTAHEFRTIAENQRRLAALSDFPWLRDRYLASADKWDVLAQARA